MPKVLAPSRRQRTVSDTGHTGVVPTPGRAGIDPAEPLPENLREQMAQSIAEHADYLREYGSLGDAVRAMKEDD